MKPELSIIIPCFNCSATLKEAFDSCFEQNLTVPYEVVMVDDGSTDATADLMRSLAKNRPDVKVVFHQKNKGGGATRNTAIQNSLGNVIFCLDSDDILPSGTLEKMYRLLIEKKADGVGIHRSIKFKGTDRKSVSHINTFGYIGQTIPFESLLEKKEGPFCPLYSTFMHTKEAFEITGGYPENHGFDTQAFAWKFLANGLVAYTCPDAEYLHRIHFNKSYYLREYESGKVNYNWFQILTEFLYVFSDTTKDFILGFNMLSDTNLLDAVNAQENILAKNYQNHLIKSGKEKYKNNLTKENSSLLTKYDAYWLACEYAKENPSTALSFFNIAFKKGLRNPVQFKKIMEKIKNEETSEKDVAGLVQQILTPENFKKYGSAAPLTTRAWRKCIRLIKKYPTLKKIFTHLYWFWLSAKSRVSERKEKRSYYERIEEIKKARKIVIDLEFGGLGDCLVWTTLPRLLKEKYDIQFYLSKQSEAIIRSKDIFKLCFEMNPYFKGFTDTGPVFKFKLFESEKSWRSFLTGCGGASAIENIERQFSVNGFGIPEIYYEPKNLENLKHTVLVDKNYISGKKLGWHYNDASFDRESRKYSQGEVTYTDPETQDLFTYADMIYSCAHFITVLSGGAALAACLKKPFTVILPHDAFGGSVDQFVFKKSSGYYTK